MRRFIGILLMILGILGGLYVGGWCMFIQPILDACSAFDTGALTGVIIGTTVLKCIFASCVGTIIAYIGIIAGLFVIE